MENDIKTILEKLTGLETKFSGLETSVSGLDTRLIGLETRLIKFEQKVDQNFKDTSESIAGVMTMASERFDKVNTRLDRIEQSVTTHAVDIDRLTDDVRLLKTKASIG